MTRDFQAEEVPSTSVAKYLSTLRWPRPLLKAATFTATFRPMAGSSQQSAASPFANNLGPLDVEMTVASRCVSKTPKRGERERERERRGQLDRRRPPPDHVFIHLTNLQLITLHPLAYFPHTLNCLRSRIRRFAQVPGITTTTYDGGRTWQAKEW